LVVTGERRHHEFPEVPTFQESGFPGLAVYGWSALMVRSETPDDVARKLAETMKEVLASQVAQDFAAKLGSELIQGTPAQMREFQASEIATLTKVANKAGLTPQ